MAAASPAQPPPTTASRALAARPNQRPCQWVRMAIHNLRSGVNDVR